MSISRHNSPVAESIEKIIKEKGIKQNVIAERSGLSARDFNNMLNGRKVIKVCNIPDIAKALGVQLNDLFIESNEKSEIERK